MRKRRAEPIAVAAIFCAACAINITENNLVLGLALAAAAGILWYFRE